MPCPRSRTALFFDLLKMGYSLDLFFFSLRLKFRGELAMFFREDLFFGERLKFHSKSASFFAQRPFLLFYFGEHLRFVSLVRGFEHSCLWPREGLSSKCWSSASSLASSTPPLRRTLFSDYCDQSLTTRSPERGFSTSITLALLLVESHCASILSSSTSKEFQTNVFHRIPVIRHKLMTNNRFLR